MTITDVDPAGNAASATVAFTLDTAPPPDVMPLSQDVIGIYR